MNTEAYQLNHIGFILINFRFSLISRHSHGRARRQRSKPGHVLRGERNAILPFLFRESVSSSMQKRVDRGVFFLHSMSSSMKRCGCLVLCWELTRSIWEGGVSHMCLRALQTVLINTLITFIHTESILILHKTEKGIKSLELGRLDECLCSKKRAPLARFIRLLLQDFPFYTPRGL